AAHMAEPMQPLQPMQAAHMAEPMQPLQPMQAARMAEPMQPLQPMQAAHMAEPMQPLQPMQAAHMAEPMQPLQPMQAARMAEPMQPLQPMQAAHMAEPMQPLQPMHRAEPMQPVHQMQAFERVEAQTAQPFHQAVAATDSTMTSGVSMTAGAPVHDVQPMQAREMYYADSTPSSEQLQPMSAGYEPMARTQMSQAYEALEPTQPREYSRIEAQPVYESVNPLMASESLSPTAAFDSGAQAGGGAAQPFRQSVAGERPARPTE
ncbi:hypothetical protein ACFWGZ_40185, partial [Lentzea sp. NPDC060358]